MQDKASYKTKWGIIKYANDADFKAKKPFETVEFDGNILLNEGITALQNLLTGAAETAFSNANAYIGIGDSNTAAAAAQTGLQAPTNKFYAPMDSGFPTITAQTTKWQSVVGSADANFDWNEFTVASGNSDAADNLNRKVSAQGTKANGQTWTVYVEITWS